MRSRTTMLLAAILGFAIVSSAVAFTRWVSNASQVLVPQSEVKVVLVVLGPEGFQPQELQLPPGQYILIVRNRTGLDDVGLRLLSELGINLGEARVRGIQRTWKLRLQLNTGRYLIAGTDRPDWTCRITVGS